MSPATVAAVVDAAARLVTLIPEASETLNHLLCLWCAKHGLDEADVLRRVQGSVRDQFGDVDRAIDAQLGALRLPRQG